ncbi:putative protein kinase, partial [Planoprotostelium fungivorum]
MQRDYIFPPPDSNRPFIPTYWSELARLEPPRHRPLPSHNHSPYRILSARASGLAGLFCGNFRFGIYRDIAKRYNRSNVFTKQRPRTGCLRSVSRRIFLDFVSSVHRSCSVFHCPFEEDPSNISLGNNTPIQRRFVFVFSDVHFRFRVRIVLRLYLMATSNETLADQITDAITAANPADKKILHRAVDQALKDAARSTLREWAAAGDITTKFDEIRAYTSPNAPTARIVAALGSLDARLTDLVKSAGQHDINPHVIDCCLKRFPQQCNLCLAGQDSKLAKSIYEETNQLPQTATEQDFRVEGYRINRSIGVSDSLVICFDKDAVPHVLKTLNNAEKDRITAIPVLQSEYIIKYSLRESNRGNPLMIMPLLPTTLEHLPDLSLPLSGKLWQHMKNALSCLHGHQLAHMDVKPSNICIDQAGNFILIDLGSVVRFGQKSASTLAYIPQDLSNYQVASAAVDWWMLAATLGERGCGMSSWGAGAANPTKEKLHSKLAKSIYEETNQLPQTATEQDFRVEGYRINRSIGVSDSLVICFDKDAVPHVLKTLNNAEKDRITAIPVLQSEYIIKYSLRESNRGNPLMIMPLLPTTLEHLPELSLPLSGKLWQHMKNALSCLHGHQLAHMDVKPSNICIDQAGNFILIDLGSVVRFGQKSASTLAYIPQDLSNYQVASAAVDWWMLAATLGGRGCGMSSWGA